MSVVSDLPAAQPLQATSSIPLDFISQIKVSHAEYPLYDHLVNPSKVYFPPDQGVVWDSTLSQTQVTPVAILSNATFLAVFSSAAIATIVPTLTLPYRLTATIKDWEIFNVTVATADKLVAKVSLPIQPLMINGVAKSLPWQIYDTVTWLLKGAKDDQPTYTCSTELEAYVLFADLPQYFLRNGLSLRLLNINQFLPKWTCSSTSDDWAGFITQAIFDDPRLQYEVWSGSSRYVSYPTLSYADDLKTDRGLTFWLDLWVSDMYGLSGEGCITVNCYDLACIVQVLTCLGIGAPTNKTRIKYMMPFGYINSTHLIGRKVPSSQKATNPTSLCNNPFYGDAKYSEMMNCDPLITNRSSFGNHMFVTIDKGNVPYVLDACCGPQLGTLKLLDYPGKTIDANVTLYKMGRRPGNITDATDGTGVERLVVSRKFLRSSVSSTSDLLDKITQLPMTGQWLEPYFASPSDSKSFTATWTFIPHNDQNEAITINVFRFRNYYDTQESYQRRISYIPDWAAENAEDGASDSTTGSIRMFCNARLYYLTTIKARIRRSEKTKVLKDDLKKLLDSSIKFSEKDEFIHSIKVVPDALTVKVGDTVKVTVVVSNP